MNHVHATAVENPDTRSATRRTLLALLAGALGAIPLKSLLSDSGWLVQGWITMVIVVAPAALLRLRRAPSALDIWPGVVLLVPWLTLVYVPHHAWGGIIPTAHTFRDVGNLMDSLHRTTSDEVAPIHSTVAVRLVISALLGLMAALIDLIAVVGRRGALGGIPLLVVYTVSGAVPRSPVAWFYFFPAAIGYLILLSLDAADELRGWGRRVSRADGTHGRQGLAFSGQRIGIAAIVVALVLPLLVPAHPKNLVANLFHGGGGSGLGNFGAVGSGGGEISPFAALKGQLQRDRPVPLMNVHIDAQRSVQPFYVRTNVLDRFNGDGWTAGSHGATEPAELSPFDTLPVTNVPHTVDFQASITITGLAGNAPVFSVPREVSGLDAGSQWSPQDQVLVGTGVHQGDQFIEQVAQPQPTIAELDAAQTVTGPDMSTWLQLPPLPTFVTNLVKRITADAATPYGKAKAIFDWFTDPANGFVYSLKTTKGDSGNDLVDFLQNRSGFCQQYAAAMGVMLRYAGVPTRLVLGYMHPAPNAAGNFTISTFDAHAWVEAFFPNVGWIPFDPTPSTGLVGGNKTDLAWAKHPSGPGGDLRPPAVTSSASPGHNIVTPGASNTPRAVGPSPSSSSGTPIWTGVVVLAVILIALLPAMTRQWRRRARLTAARHGAADALWAELSDTAVDLGYVWSPARSPRQVSAWLARDAADAAPALNALAVAVEEGRYAPNPRRQDTAELTRGLVLVTARLRGRRSGKMRLRARLWPASLGWGRRIGAVRGVLRRRH